MRLAARIAVAGTFVIGCSGHDPAPPRPGTLDASFARQGLHLADGCSVPQPSAARHAATDDSGRIWVSGGTTTPGTAIRLRLLGDGMADPDFGRGGCIASAPFPNIDPLAAADARAALPARDGGALLVDALAAASCLTGPSCGPVGAFRIVTNAQVTRVGSSGAAIPDYGVAGSAGLVVESLLDATAGPGDAVVLVISPLRGVADPSPPNRVVRLGADGRRDARFEANAAAALDCPGIESGSPALARVAALEDGSIIAVQSFVAVAPGTPRLCVSRLGADGRPDPAFGSGGRAVLDDPRLPAGAALNLRGLFANPDGSAEVAVSFLPESIDPARPPFALIAVTADGRRDPARFGPGALAGLSLPVFLATAIARDGEGRYLVGGFPFAQPSFAIETDRPRIARFRPDGMVDGSFGSSGPGFTHLRFDLSAARLEPRHLHATADAVIVAGIADFEAPRGLSRIGVARLSGR